MKVTLSLAVMALTATQVAAFPAMAEEHVRRLAESQLGKRSTASRSPVKKRALFDPKSQYVSTTGSHKFVPPNFAAGDVRGPCPGLNAAANHGVSLPRFCTHFYVLRSTQVHSTQWRCNNGRVH